MQGQWFRFRRLQSQQWPTYVREARLLQAPRGEPLEARQSSACRNAFAHLANLVEPAEQVCRRHAMVVARWGRPRRVRVRMGVHPDDAERRVGCLDTSGYWVMTLQNR